MMGENGLNKKINAMYFSATGTTQKIVLAIADTIAGIEGKLVNNIDFTLPAARKNPAKFTANDLVVFGTPVIAGRVPNLLLKYLDTLSGNGALAVSVVVYGNRNYDDAAIELKGILEAKGFKVVAAGAFVGEHSFSKTLGKDRPDAQDMLIACDFAREVYKKLSDANDIKPVDVPGNQPLGNYYMPKSATGAPIDIRKVTPKTDSALCNNCKLCAAVCPLGSIDQEDITRLNGICMKCGACIKKCPMGAKFFDDPGFLEHKEDIEFKFAQHREPELFI